MTMGDRLGGHLVSGHVDGIARVREVSPAGEALRVKLEAPEPLRRSAVPSPGRTATPTAKAWAA